MNWSISIYDNGHNFRMHVYCYSVDMTMSLWLTFSLNPNTVTETKKKWKWFWSWSWKFPCRNWFKIHFVYKKFIKWNALATPFCKSPRAEEEYFRFILMINFFKSKATFNSEEDLIWYYSFIIIGKSHILADE